MAIDNISAFIKDGKVQDASASANSLSSSKSKASASSLDKEAFLQLLVAQMKYQDPLEPTDNTEYISQLATFSELEEMQNMVVSNELARSSGLVGQEVICKVTNSSTGATEYVQGYVDYVVYENNKAYVSIQDALYSVDDVYEVVDPTYSEAFELGKKFVSAVASLPKLNDLTLEYEEAIKTLRATFNEMTDYQKSFVAKDVMELFGKYESKIKELKLGAGSADNNNETDNESSENADGVEE